jgi:hypothetical protein
MTTKHYLKAVAVLALALLWCGAVPKAGAQVEKPKAAPPPPEWQGTFHSSVQVPPAENDPDKLQAAAKVNAEEIKNAAIKVHPGWKIRYIQLKNVKGNLIYEVEFKDEKEFFFDAGTGELMNNPAKKKK